MYHVIKRALKKKREKWFIYRNIAFNYDCNNSAMYEASFTKLFYFIFNGKLFIETIKN